MIIKCDCGKEHKFQDKTYGKGNRVANPTTNIRPNGKPYCRCTVCGDIKGEIK